jgi:hypothetical protein
VNATIERVQQSIPPGMKATFDAGAFLSGLAAMLGHLTTIGGFLVMLASLVWTVIRVYETKTIQRWIEKRRKG